MVLKCSIIVHNTGLARENYRVEDIIFRSLPNVRTDTVARKASIAVKCHSIRVEYIGVKPLLIQQRNFFIFHYFIMGVSPTYSYHCSKKNDTKYGVILIIFTCVMNNEGFGRQENSVWKRKMPKLCWRKFHNKIMKNKEFSLLN